MTKEETIKRLREELSADASVREEIIRFLASDFPEDFLSPVKINTEALAGIAGGGIMLSSDKEWQE
jgi:hypothetical protein